jgi:copper transport protein
MDEFLADDASDAGSSRRLWGRTLGLLGVVGAIGGIAFLASTLRGDAREITMGLRIVAGLGVIVAVAAGIEYSGTIVQTGASASAAWASTPGVAMALRFAGGLAVTVGAIVAASRMTIRGPSRSLSAAVFDQAEARPAIVPLCRWSPTSAPLVLAGAGLLVASFWFDGHTVSRGQRIIHSGVNSVHVIAGAVWVGGVVALALTLWSRHRRQLPARAGELIVRFSTIASISLVAVGLAGAVMTAFVVDSPDDLVSTEWGKTLLLKTLAVALAALGGAYNHFRLRPRLEANPDSPGLEAEFRYTLVAEAIVLCFVVVVTAWLVAASTT